MQADPAIKPRSEPEILAPLATRESIRPWRMARENWSDRVCHLPPRSLRRASGARYRDPSHRSRECLLPGAQYRKSCPNLALASYLLDSRKNYLHHHTTGGVMLQKCLWLHEVGYERFCKILPPVRSGGISSDWALAWIREGVVDQFPASPIRSKWCANSCRSDLRRLSSLSVVDADIFPVLPGRNVSPKCTPILRAEFRVTVRSSYE